MQVRASMPSDTIKHKIYIIAHLHDLDKIELSDSERAYAESGFESRKSLSINRFEEHLHLIKPGAESDAATGKELLRREGNALVKVLNREKAAAASIESLDPSLNALAVAEGIALGNYQFLKYYSDKDKRKNSLTEIAVKGADEQELKWTAARIRGNYLARNLVNEPLSFLTATQLAEEATRAGAESGFKVEVLNKKKIESLKMGGLLAVNRGSQDPPTFTIMEYKPEHAKNKQPVVLVGKGVVYDTGGMSLKPTANSMDSMKSDMAGAAAVIGTMQAVAEAGLDIHVIGLVPATDNRPGENAYVPGDVITMFDGSTVEVLNTDAEGRMLLADALAYAKKYKPQMVFDLATLTGAAAIAIGKYGVVGMGTADEKEFHRLEQAGFDVHERVARFPFWKEYSDLLKSTIADMKNIGGREAGAITAGKFLHHFTDYPWIHLDIAGPAFLDGNDHYRLQGGTGVGVRLMFEYLKAL